MCRAMLVRYCQVKESVLVVSRVRSIKEVLQALLHLQMARSIESRKVKIAMRNSALT
jgi:hypothetical protein